MVAPVTSSWVWSSTPASRAAGQTSLLALLETTLCVAAYWAIWHAWGAMVQHGLIVLATPLVLLRSDRSLLRGATWFDAYLSYQHPPGPIAAPRLRVVLPLALFSILIVNEIARYPATALGSLALAGLMGWLAVNLVVAQFIASARNLGRVGHRLAEPFLAANLTLIFCAGTGISQAVMLPQALAVLFGLFAGGYAALMLASRHLIDDTPSLRASLRGYFGLHFGVFLGVFLRALATRLLATLGCLWPGLRALPENWSRAISVTDIFEPPELVPGSRRIRPGHAVSFLRNRPEGQARHPVDRLFEPAATVLFFLPALLWRWSIKSTAWFYLPLAFVTRTGMAETDADRARLAKAHSRKLINILFLLVALLHLSTAALAMLRPDWLIQMLAKASAAGAPVPVLGYLLVLDWSRLADQPWQWALLPAALLSVGLFFLYDSIGRNIDCGIPPDRYATRLRLMQRAANLSLALSLSGTALMLWDFGHAQWNDAGPSAPFLRWWAG